MDDDKTKTPDDVKNKPGRPTTKQETEPNVFKPLLNIYSTSNNHYKDMPLYKLDLK